MWPIISPPLAECCYPLIRSTKQGSFHSPICQLQSNTAFYSKDLGASLGFDAFPNVQPDPTKATVETWAS